MPGRKGWQNHKKLLSAEKECLKSVWQSFLLFTSHNQPPHIFLSFLWSRWDLSLNFESTLRVTHFPLHIFYVHSLVQFSSVTQSCLTLCDPMNCSTPGLPVHHQLPEFIQTHVRWVGDAIQPSHLLSAPSPPAPNPSQHQGLFKWVSSSHQVAKVLEFQIQHQSFQWIFRTDCL